MASPSSALLPLSQRDLSRDPYPDSAYIDELIYRCRWEFNQRDGRDLIRDLVYKQTNDIAHPAHIDFQEVHMGMATKMAREIVGILADRPVTVIGENSLNTMKIQRAESVQNACNAIWPALESQAHPNGDVWLKVLQDQTVFGRGYDVLEYVPSARDIKAGHPKVSDYDSLDGFEQAKKRFDITGGGSLTSPRLPMVWRHLPSRGVFVWEDDWGIQECISIEERRVMDVARRYNRPDLLDDIDWASSPSMHVIFCRYWNRSYYAYWVSRGYASQTWEQRAQSGMSLLTLAGTHNDVLDVGPNIYGRVPVIESRALSSTDPNPSWKHLSPIDQVIPLASYLDELVSQKGSAVRVWAWPTPYVKYIKAELGPAMQQVPTTTDGRPQPMNIVPGKVLYLQPGQDIGWLVAQDNGADANSQIELIMKAAEGLGIPSSLFDGSAQANGYLYNQMFQAATTTLKPMVLHTQLAHKERVELFFTILRIHGDPLYIYQPGSTANDLGNWTSITPKDVEDWEARYVITIDYDKKQPFEEAADVASFMQLTTPRGPRPPALTDATAMKKFLHMDNPEKEIAARMIQQFDEQPPVQQFLTGKLLSQAGMTLDEEEGGAPPLSPEEAAMLPPALVQAAGGELTLGGPGMSAQPGATGNGVLAAPSTLGGVPGAPAAPVVRGLTHPLTPAGPSPVPHPAPGPKPKGQPGISGLNRGGRARGQARKPPKR